MSTTVKKNKYTLSNIISYLQGWSRYRLYYSSGPLRFLMRKHIREQITTRINSMNKECYNSGSCVECGCATTALQMSNKSCEGMCYPPMVGKSFWNYMNKGARLLKHKKSGTYWTISWEPEIVDEKWNTKINQKFFKL